MAFLVLFIEKAKVGNKTYIFQNRSTFFAHHYQDICSYNTYICSPYEYTQIDIFPSTRNRLYRKFKFIQI